MQPLKGSSEIWKDLSRDFIEGLPTAKGYNHRLKVLVDRLIKKPLYGSPPSPIYSVVNSIDRTGSNIEQPQRHHTQVLMKIKADKHCQDIHVDAGDKVYVKMRPYGMKSLAKGHKKLVPKCFVPFEILGKIAQVA